MRNLVAKLMSTETLPDSDTRKLYKLIPVPFDHHVEFQRDQTTQAAKMVFVKTFGETSGSEFPLVDCGNVYILSGGQTVASFNPNIPQPMNIVARTGSFQLNTEVDAVVPDGRNALYTEFKGKLDTLTPGGVYPMAKMWNHDIATALADCKGTVHLQPILECTDEHKTARYYNRVRDALLNCSCLVVFEHHKLSDGVMRLNFISPEQISNLKFTQTDKQQLINKKVDGLTINNINRAVKLLNYGARHVLTTQPLHVPETSVEAIKDLIRRGYDYSTKFHFEGGMLIGMSFDPIPA